MVTDASIDLMRTIETTITPGAPLRLSRRGATSGLALLEAAVSLRHVRRLTERLQISDFRNSRRLIEVDINLELLDDDLWSALRAASRREHTDRPEGSSKQLLWLPIARIFDRNGIPVEVRDAYSTRLPTMTQYETAQMLASGMYQLLRGILVGHEDAADPTTDLSKFLFRVHESRWIVQQAILTLMTRRNDTAGRVLPERTAGTVPGIQQQYRRLAVQILERYGDVLHDYFELLNIAVNEYLLIVGVDASEYEHNLSYAAPLHVDDQPRPHARLIRRLRAARSGYYIKYISSIPPTLRSYHLIAETPEGLDIEILFLQTDADLEVASQVSTDLKDLSELSVDPTTSVSKSDRKLLEMEMHHVLRRLTDLWNRRQWDAETAGRNELDVRTPSCARLAHVLTSGEAVAGEGPTNNSTLLHPAVTATNLARASMEIVDNQLARDLSVSGSPDVQRAHASWRPPAGEPQSSGQITVEASILIADSTAFGPRTARTYALTVAATAYLLGSLLNGTLFPIPQFRTALGMGNTPAVVGVLLLLPAFLYTRLALPNRRSIAGYLQVLPRSVAHLCVFLATASAAAVAAHSSDTILTVMFGLIVLLPPAASLLLSEPRAGRTKDDQINRLGGPTWLQPVTGRGYLGARRPDETLHSSRSLR